MPIESTAMSSAPTLLVNVRLADRPGAFDLELSEGRIDAIRPTGAPLPAGARKIDGRGLTAAPGFMDATEEAYRKSGEYHAAGGTTAYLPTTATESPDAIFSCIDMAARSREQGLGGVEILGVHVEGPYMAPTKHGCHDPGYVRRPSKEENRGYLDRARIVKRITLAPEVPGVQDFIRDLSRHGIISSGGNVDP